MRLLLATLVLAFGSVPVMAKTAPRYAIAVHGGAGVYEPEKITPAQRAAYKAGITDALRAGEAVLAKGGSALDAVQAAVMVLEDNPLFNAGRGAVLTADGRAELDASIMDGKTLKAGAVAGVTTTKNPIRAARAVMDQSEHVMLARDGADAFSKSVGLEQVPNDYFITPERREQLKKAQSSAELYRVHKLGTVGAVALDLSGTLAAATSTGGMTNKRWGRIGDSPIIGAGTYAENGVCAVSGTGWGEYFIRVGVAKTICALVQYRKAKPDVASREVLDRVEKLGGDGGVIVIDGKGRIALEFNTPGMFRGSLRQGEAPVAMITRDD
jgi:L-asparaginase / beta-aspartyl-peptidase